MRLRVLECPRCGAPLPRRALLVRLVCEYCRSEVTVDRWSVRAADYRREQDRYATAGGGDIVAIQGLPWRLLRRIARGHSSDVFLAERATRLSERAVLKLLRDDADEPLLRREQEALSELEQSTVQGAAFFSSLLPQRVAYGRTEGASAGKLAALFRAPVGFAHTLSEVQRLRPDGLDPRHVVWLWGRSLELVDWLHRSGFVHGALLPQHVLIDAREHATRLVGFSCAARAGAALTAMDPGAEALYPGDVLGGAGLSTSTDLTMLARTMLTVVAPASTPPELARLLESEAAKSGRHSAAEVREALRATARRCFGAPVFVPLQLD